MYMARFVYEVKVSIGISQLYCAFLISNMSKIRSWIFLPARYDDDVNNYLDTGGGNWPRLYSTMNRSEMVFCNERIERIGEGNDYHNDFVELLDDSFLHTINGSEVQYEKEGYHISKNSLLQGVIGQFEGKC